MSFNNPLTVNNPREILRRGTLGSPQIGTTVLGNLPSIPLISPQSYFLQQMESWISSPSNSSQWVLLFDDFPQILKTEVIRELEPNSASGWNIPYKQMTNYFLQKAIGCVFAQNVEIPRERINVNNINPKRGFRGTPVADIRTTHLPLTLSFMETNLSFVDSILRPWAILTSHKGLVARPPEDSIKTNVTIIQYAKTNQYLSQIARKMWTFYDVACIYVPNVPYDYEKSSVEKRTGIEFTYNSYKLYNTTYIPVFSLIDKFSNGGLNEIKDVAVVGQSIKNLGKLL